MALQLVDVPAGGGQQFAPDALGDLARLAAQQGLVEPPEVFDLVHPLGVDGREAPLADLRPGPLGADGDDVLVEPGRVVAVEAEAGDQVDQRDRARRLGQAGPREVVVDEPLRLEPPEEPLADPVLQVHVDRLDPRSLLRLPRRA